jgi:hypothetical protein
MKPCRECQHEISEQAISCPRCGAPFPAKEKWDGWGFEYKSKMTFMGLPLLHISFKYRPNRIPVPAKGVIAIGQFACGIFTLSQFGIGVVSVSQFAFAYSLIAQFGIFIREGHGQLVKSLSELIRNAATFITPPVVRTRVLKSFPAKKYSVMVSLLHLIPGKGFHTII